MIDCHTHSAHSHDSKEDEVIMVEKAITLGLDYFAITNHLDNDCKYNYLGDNFIAPLDVEGWNKTITDLRTRYEGKLNIAFGLEIGYDKPSQSEDAQIISSFGYDVIINSVHNVSSMDIYLDDFYKDKTKNKTYTDYLLTVLDSVKCATSYDVVGHLGYVMRKAPYSPRIMEYTDFANLIDEILLSIISQNKTLEVNTHTKGVGGLFMPDLSVLARYKALGGECVCFGSDAHTASQMVFNYSTVSQAVLDLGFKYWTCYKNRTQQKIKIV